MAFESAVAAGKARRARRFMCADNHSVIVAMEHPSVMGVGPTPEAISEIAAGGPDGVLATWDQARTYADALSDIGIILRIDGGYSMMGERTGGDSSGLLFRLEQAAVLGADGVVVMAFPGAPGEHVSLRRLAAVVREAELIGMPVMAESVPGGFGRAVEWNTENVVKAGRIAVELGADVIKTLCPGDPADFAEVVEGIPAPIVVLGGPKSESEDEVVDTARGVVAAGAAGVCFGRNVWGAADPGAMVAKLRAAVHGG